MANSACCADDTKPSPFLIFKQEMIPKDNIPRKHVIHVHSVVENGIKPWLGKCGTKCPGGLLRKKHPFSV
jgi:hypothetical protein